MKKYYFVAYCSGKKIERVDGYFSKKLAQKRALTATCLSCGIKKTIAFLDNFDFFSKKDSITYKIKFLKDQAI